ncbi:retrotransposon protein, putative, ty1-copia subclass, partial [Tanacetum coccineum]
GINTKPKNPKPSAKERPRKDDTCHHCKEVGHWKRNYPVYLAELIVKKKQVGTASSSGLRGARKLKQEDLYLYVGNGVRVQVEAIRSYDLVLPNGLVICLDNCHYVPTITRGVVLVSRLVNNGFTQCFTDYRISVSKNDVLYFNAISSNGIYEIDMINRVPNVNSIYTVSNKRAKHNLDSTYLWHCRLAHISKKRIEKLQHDGLLKSTDEESFDKCVSCLSGKMTRKPFPHRTERETDLLRIIHTDVCGPLRHVSRQDYALETATHILNIVPTKKVDKTPYELWYGKVPNLSYLKWEAENLQETRHVMKKTPPSKNTSEIPMEIKGFEPPQEEVVPIRRSARAHQAPNRLCQNIEVEEHSLGILMNPNVPYASTVGSIMNVVRCTRPDVAFAQNITSHFQQNPGEPHWTTVKTILKYLRNTKDMFLVYGGNPKAELRVDCYCDAGFETDRDDTKSQTCYVFILNGGAVDWKSSK